MKHLLLALCLITGSTLLFAQPKGYQIRVTLKPFKNQYIYLGYHYGNAKPIFDSVKLDAQSTGIFKGKEKLKGGIYLVGYPDRRNYFEILVDQQQNFAVQADTTDIINKLRFTNSEDNTIFSTYQQYVSVKGGEATEARKKWMAATTSADSAKWMAVVKKTNDEVQAYRNNIEQKYPKSLLTALLRAIKEPIVPPAAQHPGGKYDSMFAYNYYKARYWDGISFTDERLVRTPIFEGKLVRYFKQVLIQSPDTLTKEAERIVALSKPAKEMFKYVLSKLVEMYINPEFMGQDKVYVALFEKYIASNQADWFTEKQRTYLFDRGYYLMANQLGMQAANINLVDTLEKPVSVYGIKGDYTVICFWDPTCGHCKEVVPRLDSFFQQKWKQRGVQLLGIMSDGGKQAWVEYIREHKLNGWIHAYETEAMKKALYDANQPNFRQLYDVITTPVLYLLDKDKRIIAKKLTFDQIDNVIDQKRKQ